MCARARHLPVAAAEERGRPMNTPDNCYADKSHSAHDLMAPGEKCKHCGFVMGARPAVMPELDQTLDVLLACECSLHANQVCDKCQILRPAVAKALHRASLVTDLHRRALEACEELSRCYEGNPVAT